jgi:hypothetical protein
MNKFSFPNTINCIVVWYRNNVKHETTIPTPRSNSALQMAMLANKVGMSEIRAIKADNSSQLTSLASINPANLAAAMIYTKNMNDPPN